MLIAFLQDVDDHRIEGFARFSAQFLHDLTQRQSAPVLAIGGERVEIVDGRENARADGNFGSLQPHGITGPIPFFVVGANDRDDGIWEAHALQNLSAHKRMNLHLFEFFRRKAAGLRDNVFRNGKFSDVVQQRGGMKSFEFRSAHA